MKDKARQLGHQRNHYARNRDAVIAKVAARNAILKAEARALIRAAKSRPCMDCGGMFPYYVMDLDHRRGEKVACIAEFMRKIRISKRMISALILEIAKCDPVCANCHRERSYGPAK